MSRCARILVSALALAVLATGCSSDSAATPEQAVPADRSALPIRIPNEGGSLEGHTPREFAGSGTGLFTGDNLNPSFPNGVGIQILLTFELPAAVERPSLVRLVSDAMQERGDAFSSLGALQAEPVSYESFGPALFELQADGPATTCLRTGESRLECDLTTAALDAIDTGADRFQVRVQFEAQSDNDGQQDLALFFLTDSNTNEPGIFFLELS